MRVLVELRIDAAGRQRVETLFHHPPVADGIVFAHANVGGRLPTGVVRVPGVLQHQRTGARQRPPSETVRPVRGQIGGDMGADRAAPERITLRADVELLRTGENLRDRDSQIFAGGFETFGPIVERKGVEAHAAQFQRVRQAFMERRHILEAATRADNGKRRFFDAAEIEQPRLRLGRSPAFFLVGIEIVEDLFAVLFPREHGVEDVQRGVDAQMPMIREQRRDLPQRAFFVGFAQTSGEKEPAISLEILVCDDICDFCFSVHSRRTSFARDRKILSKGKRRPFVDLFKMGNALESISL